MESKADMDDNMKPALLSHVRVHRDRVSGKTILLYPEGALELDEEGEAIIALCDGGRGFSEILDALMADYDVLRSDLETDVRVFLSALKSRGLMKFEAASTS